LACFAGYRFIYDNIFELSLFHTLLGKFSVRRPAGVTLLSGERVSRVKILL